MYCMVVFTDNSKSEVRIELEEYGVYINTHIIWDSLSMAGRGLACRNHRDTSLCDSSLFTVAGIRGLVQSGVADGRLCGRRPLPWLSVSMDGDGSSRLAIRRSVEECS